MKSKLIAVAIAIAAVGCAPADELTPAPTEVAQEKADFACDAILILPCRDLKKGLDLTGGHELVFKIDMEGDEDSLAVQKRMIEILKQRVDRLGLENLEWRPAGRDRIMIRMPDGDE